MRNNDFLKIMILRESFSRKDEKRNTVVKKTNFYAIQKIELIADARVIGDDPKNHVVKINDGTNILYKKLLLDTGNQARQLLILGDKLYGIFIRKIK